MALPTTNLSLNAIHTEVGGTAGTLVSLNDADVRSIGNPDPTYAPSGISTTPGTEISFGLFRNASDGTPASVPVTGVDGTSAVNGVTVSIPTTIYSGTVTVGGYSTSDKTANYYYYGFYINDGYRNTFLYPNTAFGSRSPTTLTLQGSSRTITAMYHGLYSPFSGSPAGQVGFSVLGTLTNTGFSQFKVGTTTYNRSSATHANVTSSYDGLAYTTWSWSTTTNPFGTSGSKSVEIIS